MDTGYLTVEGECRYDTAVLIVCGDLDAAVSGGFAERAAKAVADLVGAGNLYTGLISEYRRAALVAETAGQRL